MRFFTNIFLSLLATFFMACNSENTKEPIVTDIQSISIDNDKIDIYSTDAPVSISGTVTYLDGTTAEATLAKWTNSDYEVMHVANNSVWGGISNGGTATLGLEFEQFNDSIEVNVHKLTSFFISSEDITTTGDFILEAKGSFDNNETNRTIVKNIIWSADNDAVISVEDDVVTITVESGDTNVTATVFNDTNTSSPIAPISKVYTVE
jgi:hypothetical protein